MLTVSVILTTYNGASRGYLKEAIESVLNQTYSDYELLLVDDGSSDQTLKMCTPYLKQNKIFLIQQKNQGPSAARNHGIKKARGEYICFLDDDDVWEATKLEEQVLFLKTMEKKFNNVGMIDTNLKKINAKGNFLKIFKAENNGDVFEKLFFQNTVAGPSSVMIKKTVLDSVGGFEDNSYCSIKSAEDYDLWLKIAAKYKIFSLNRPLVRYRVHLNNLSANIQNQSEAHLNVLRHHLQNAPVFVKQKTNQLFYSVYVGYAKSFFSSHAYKKFRQYIIIASSYKKISFILKIKYFLSFFPPIINLLLLFKKIIQQ